MRRSKFETGARREGDGVPGAAKVLGPPLCLVTVLCSQCSFGSMVQHEYFPNTFLLTGNLGPTSEKPGETRQW